VASAPYAVAGADTLRVFRFGTFTDGVKRPAVLLLHGGGWTGGEPRLVYPAAQAFADAGFVAMAVQYRLSDSLRTPIEALADVCAALRWTRLRADSLGVDSSRVALYGSSAGGHLAASTVTIGCPDALWDRGADALLLLSPAVDVADDEDLTALLRGRATAADLSPVAHPRAGMPPTVLIQGAADPYTTLAGAQRFCLIIVSQRQTCDLRVYEGLGHVLGRNIRDDGRPFDPDPVARADALRHQVQSLVTLWRPGRPLDSP
jgi:acetyl esterase/lipase